MPNETIAYINLAHSGHARAVHKLWDIYGQDVLNAALIQSFIHQSDFSLRGLPKNKRRDHILGKVYEIFHDLVHEFDPKRNDDFLGFVCQHIKWCTLTEKRNNAKLYTRERLGVEAPEQVAEPDDYEKKNDLKALTHLAEKTLSSDPKLLKSFVEFEKVHEYMDKGKFPEAADRLNITRASAYNRTKACRKILLHNQNRPFTEEFLSVLAA